MYIINGPKNFQANNVISFLNEAQKAFSLKGKKIPDMHLELTKVRTADMLSTLLIYKFLDYTVTNSCFENPLLHYNPVVIAAWEKYGFAELIQGYMNQKLDLSSYKNLQIKVEDNFIIAPQALLREDNYSDKNLKNNFLPKIEEYYSFNDKVVSMIFICLSEILLNFWEHAVEDTKSIIVANGNNYKIEIACADTGKGIISTLGDSLQNKKLTKEKILAKSLEQGITSKIGTNHMGYGLWILNEIVTLTKGRLQLFSQGSYYINEFGKIKNGLCGYWQGTIIYISLPLESPKTLADIEEYKGTSAFKDLQINFS